jgi:hypothetical protein
MLLLAATGVVCLSAQPLSTEPLKNGCARVTRQYGQVSVWRGTPVALFVGSDIKRQEMIITGHDGFARFEVADGSWFEVYADSKVVFHNNPTVSYKDLLNVVIGKIKVYIQHLNGPNYNSVTTPTAVISVRGTIFVVDVEDEDGTTVVAVDDGLVQVKNTTAAGKEPLLQPGDAIRVYRGQSLGLLADHSGVLRAAFRAIEDAMRVAVQRGSGGGLPGTGGVGGTGGAQGDKGKNTGGSGTGSTTGSSAPTGGPKPGGGG